MSFDLLLKEKYFHKLCSYFMISRVSCVNIGLIDYNTKLGVVKLATLGYFDNLFFTLIF